MHILQIIGFMIMIDACPQVMSTLHRKVTRKKVASLRKPVRIVMALMAKLKSQASLHSPGKNTNTWQSSFVR